MLYTVPPPPITTTPRVVPLVGVGVIGIVLTATGMTLWWVSNRWVAGQPADPRAPHPGPEATKGPPDGGPFGTKSGSGN